MASEFDAIWNKFGFDDKSKKKNVKNSESDNELIKLSQQKIEEYQKKRSTSVFDWNETTVNEFRRIPIETLIKDKYFLGMEDRVFEGVLEDIVDLFETRRKKQTYIAVFLEGIGCLHPDTFITTIDRSKKKLKNIQVGDYILDKNYEKTKVLEIKNTRKTEFIIITDSGRKVSSSNTHPFEFLNRSFQNPKRCWGTISGKSECYIENLSKLEIGSELIIPLNNVDSYVTAQREKIVEIKTTKKAIDMIDIMVDSKTQSFIANGIATHNSGKTLKSSIIQWLLWFELCLYGDPQEYFDLTPGSTIALINLNRCVAEGTLIATNMGLIPIEKIIKEKLKLLALTKSNNYEKVIDYFDNGEKDGFSITTDYNYNIKSSKNHPYWNGNKFILARDLRVGDKVSIRASNYKFGNDETISTDQAYVLEDFSNNEILPEEIFQSPRKTIVKVLSGLFNIKDGETLYNKKIISNNHKLFLQIQNLLLILGLISDLQIDEFNSIYTIEIKNIEKDNDDYLLGIKKIDEVKIKTYDLTIENDHTYIANGFIVHNTEAQARKVTFTEVAKRFDSPFNKDYFPVNPRITTELRISRNNTVIFPGTSSALSALGYNLFGGAVDEACFVKNLIFDINLSRLGQIIEKSYYEKIYHEMGNLEVNDELYFDSEILIESFNIETGEKEFKTFESLKCMGYKDIYDVELEDGTILSLTSNQKVLTKTNEYKRVDELLPSDEILEII